MNTRHTSCYMPADLAAVFLLTIAALLTAPAVRAEAQPLKVCADPANPPFSSKDEKGFENRIASLMAKKMGRKLEYTWFPQRMGFIRNTLKSELRKGVYKCDLVMGVPSAYELAATTRPYYRSTYALVYGKNRGLDEMTKASELAALAKKAKPRIGVFDRGPGQLWFFYNDLIDDAIPYRSQAGDPNETPLQILNDIVADEVDVALIWGPFAGNKVLEHKGVLGMVPMSDEEDPQYPSMRFNYSISMAVRYGEKEWKEKVNAFLDDNQDAVNGILRDYSIPLLPLKK